MKRKTKITKLFLFIFCNFVFISNAYSQSIADQLILDITGYKASNNPSCGIGSGILSSADHFYYDHQDMIYRISYYNLEKRTGAEVQVTEHVGGNSDQWLLHESEYDFRNYYGLPGKSYVMREVDGQTIMALGAGGWAYRWLSDNKVIHIEYTDLQMTKPEPMSIIKAYLSKHPSTLPLMTSYTLRTKSNKTEWIKDEMERRLWLCDKWFRHHQAGKVKLSVAMRKVAAHAEVFLNYREKYFKKNAEKDIRALSEYLNSNEVININNRLESYSQWWNANKHRSIKVP